MASAIRRERPFPFSALSVARLFIHKKEGKKKKKNQRERRMKRNETGDVEGAEADEGTDQRGETPWGGTQVGK